MLYCFSYCKGNANRTQSSLLGIAEVQLTLCKGTANTLKQHCTYVDSIGNHVEICSKETKNECKTKKLKCIGEHCFPKS